MSRILSPSPGGWTEHPSALVLAGSGRVLSLVGGGGKTTLLYHLARDLQASGHRTAVVTTTKIYRPDRLCLSSADCQARWAEGDYAVCGQPVSAEKIGPPGAALLTWLLDRADRVLIEADGARHLPCKVPADHEPVLLPQCDTVLGVVGLSALGKPVAEVCFRPELACALLGCEADHRLTIQDLAHLLLSPQGTRKDVGSRDYRVVLNQCDTPTHRAAALDLAALLARQGHTQTYLTCFL